MTRKNSPSSTLSLAEARRIALGAQGFGARPAPAALTPKHLAAQVQRLGLLQLDSVNVLVRSHYLPLFSRLGIYEMAALDEMARGKRRALFEYWGHEASLIPVEFQPLLRWRMEDSQRETKSGFAKFARANRKYIDAVLSEVRARGPLRTSDLSHGEKSRSGWWEWGERKSALEYLFWTGAVTASHRQGFERHYDVPERVLPAHILKRPTPPRDEAQRTLMAMAARATGVATARDLLDYFRLPVADAKARIAELVEMKTLVPVQVEGWREPAFMHKDTAYPGAIDANALLSPFDSLIWMRPRLERLFEFHYRLAFYTPKHKRSGGYYVLPFLLGDRIVARVDLKSERKRGELLVLGGHAEAHIDPADIAEPLLASLERMAQWLGLERVRIAPKGLLLRALRNI